MGRRGWVGRRWMWVGAVFFFPFFPVSSSSDPKDAGGCLPFWVTQLHMCHKRGRKVARIPKSDRPE